MYLFVTREGEFCNQTLKVTGSTWTWLMGHLTRLPDSAVLERQELTNEIASGRLRIIYLGASAGAMHFQEVWVRGNQFLASFDRGFDQFASTVDIGGLRFVESEAKPDSVKGRYAFGPRIEASGAALRSSPINLLR
jgi:hypothetical protein